MGDRDLIWEGSGARALVDDDLQLALWLSYELRYRGVAEVDDEWQREPTLLALQRSWEDRMLAGLQSETRRRYGSLPSAPTATRVTAELEELAATEPSPSLSRYLLREASSRQFAEFLVHRSVHLLQKADPHEWVLPRLSGAVKAALITLQPDAFDRSAATAVGTHLFRELLQDWDLDDTYGAHVAQVPGVTLLGSNVISVFALRRRWRGALVGHLSLLAITSADVNRRYAAGHRRLGGGDDAAAYFDELVTDDAGNDKVTVDALAGGLARTEPDLGSDIVFGARCSALADGLRAEHVLGAWSRGRSSLRWPLVWPVD